MPDEFLIVLTFLTALASGLMGGVFFTFSGFAMKGLAMLPPAQGAAAMQSINVAVLNPLFLSLFCAPAAASVVLILFSLGGVGEPDAIFRIIGSVLYLAGTLLVTIVFNVPRNDALAAVDADSASGAARWEQYVPGWTAWNTVRTVASLTAAASFTIALLVG